MNKYLVTEVEGLANNETTEFNAWDGSYYKIVPNMENKTVVVVCSCDYDFLGQLYDGYFENLGFGPVYKEKDGAFSLKLVHDDYALDYCFEEEKNE